MQLKFIKLLFLTLVFLSLPIFCLADNTFPSFPMAFWGNATINGELLPAGTTIRAYCNNNLIGEVTMVEDGIYGYIESTKNKLLVSSCDNDIPFKYLLLGSEENLTGGIEIKHTEGFISGATINKDLNFITTRSCDIPYGIGIQTWDDNHWGECTIVNCNNGYHQEGSNCVADVSEVPDTTPPVITLLGENPVNLYAGNSYTDAGAIASDDVDGDITSDIVVGGDTVDTSTVGTYVITYNVLDVAGNPADELTRTVNVSETSGGGGGGGGGGGYTPSTTSSSAIQGDINGDDKVDKYDFALMMSAWGQTGANESDLNGDNKVDKYDFALLMSKWSTM